MDDTESAGSHLRSAAVAVKKGAPDEREASVATAPRTWPAVASAAHWARRWFGGGQVRANHLTTQVNAFSEQRRTGGQRDQQRRRSRRRRKSGSGWGVVGDTDSNSYAAVEGHNATQASTRRCARESAGNGMGVNGQRERQGRFWHERKRDRRLGGSLRGIAMEAFAPGAEAAIRFTARHGSHILRGARCPWGSIPFSFRTLRSQRRRTSR